LKSRSYNRSERKPEGAIDLQRREGGGVEAVEEQAG
jgi:hypothetical protein